MSGWLWVVILNGITAAAYSGIVLFIVRGLLRTGQFRNNRLAVATAAIFTTCAAHHLIHAWHLRFTTKFDDVRELVTLDHGRRTRVRLSVNADDIAHRFEGGTARMPARIEALRQLALAGYRVGLTIAPIMPIPQWREQYARLLANVSDALRDVPDLDLTAEIITHRFTPSSKDVLLSWYPGTKLEMDEGARTAKRNKFGGVKYVYPKDTMAEMRSWFTDELRSVLPDAQLLYWT
ncbi:hypothetical protein QM588_21070 [Rhodococcus sp. IEGM 1354]|uniref:spore photoproduct lyase family protein n=1 Tax=Rhodococcus sp. IEGM 1354 TaxID=3047088 RepID=UPI0024B716BF|nr:hypothetical protein [Rhodococcus sp. IEGM 1354]MDI9932919.1 hypothetical protein [Rhodococcus sp. IEGM 1354]